MARLVMALETQTEMFRANQKSISVRSSKNHNVKFLSRDKNDNSDIS